MNDGFIDDELPSLAAAFAERLHGRDISRDDLEQEFVRFGQRIRAARSDDPRVKISMQVDGQAFAADGPASIVNAAYLRWESRARLHGQPLQNRPRLVGNIQRSR